MTVTSTLQNSELAQAQQITEWLNRQAQAYSDVVRFLPEAAHISSGRFIRLPVVFKGDARISEKVELMQNWEDTWNEQEPEPAYQVVLVPAAG